MQNTIAILIPAYNEEKTIEHIVQSCLRYSHNVIVIDDGSTDDTIQKITALPMTLLTNQTNLGKGAALKKGFQHVVAKKFLGVITIDADGQHDPNDLPKFFEIASQFSKSIIIGARKLKTEAAPRQRWIANKIADFFISIAAKKKLQDTQSGFRYYPADFLKMFSLHAQANRFAFETDILISAVRAGLLVYYVDIFSCYPKCARASYYRTLQDSFEIFKVIFPKSWFLKKSNNAN